MENFFRKTNHKVVNCLMQYGGQIEHIQTMTKLRNLLYYFSISYWWSQSHKGWLSFIWHCKSADLIVPYLKSYIQRLWTIFNVTVFQHYTIFVWFKIISTDEEVYLTICYLNFLGPTVVGDCWDASLITLSSKNIGFGHINTLFLVAQLPLF